MAQDLTPPDPAVVLDLITAFRRSKILFAAVALGVFDGLEVGPLTGPELARALETDAGGLERLLHACVGLGLLQRDGPRFWNAPTATAFLTRSSPSRLTGYIHYSNDVMWRLWEHLEDAVREGTHRWKQAFGWEGPIFSHFFRNEEMKREFLMGMHGFGLLSSPHVASAFDLGRFHRLVDLGAATGHLTIAACERWPNLRGVVFDLPEALGLARELVARARVADRIELMGGDFFVDPLPEGDLFALGRIVHDWNEEKIHRLLQRIFERLPPGGALLIAEKVVFDDRSGPGWAQLQDLNMLTVAEGRERTLGEYEAILKRAGFSEVRCRRTPSPLDAILATRT